MGDVNVSTSNLSNGDLANGTSSYPSCASIEESNAVQTGVITIYGVIFVISIIGNSLILSTVYRTPRMRTAANLFIANMAASDVMQAIFGVPRVIVEVLYGREAWLVGGTTGEVLCKLAYFIQDTSLSVSILSLIGITAERFHAVAHPIRDSFLKLHVRIILPLIWAIAVCMHSVYFSVFRIKRNEAGRRICYQDWPSFERALIYYNICFTGLFLLALFTIIVLYALIIIKLKRKWPSEGAGIQVYTVRKAREIQERKILVVAVAITVVFFACFIPQVVLVIGAPSQTLPKCTTEVLRFITKIMEQSYAAFNPIICLLFSQNYRDGFNNALSSCCKCEDEFAMESSHHNEPAKHDGEMVMTPLPLRSGIRMGMTIPCAISPPAIMRAEGVVMNK